MIPRSVKNWSHAEANGIPYLPTSRQSQSYIYFVADSRWSWETILFVFHKLILLSSGQIHFISPIQIKTVFVQQKFCTHVQFETGRLTIKPCLHDIINSDNELVYKIILTTLYNFYYIISRHKKSTVIFYIYIYLVCFLKACLKPSLNFIVVNVKLSLEQIVWNNMTYSFVSYRTKF